MTSPLNAARPQPITKASGTVGLVATLVAALVSFGIVPAATGDAVVSAATVGIPSAVALYAALHVLAVHFTAKAKTTPVADPKAVVMQPDGSTVLDPLVPLSLTVNPYGDDGSARSAGAHAADAQESDTADDPAGHPDFDSSV